MRRLLTALAVTGVMCGVCGAQEKGLEGVKAELKARAEKMREAIPARVSEAFPFEKELNRILDVCEAKIAEGKTEEDLKPVDKAETELMKVFAEPGQTWKGGRSTKDHIDVRSVAALLEKLELFAEAAVVYGKIEEAPLKSGEMLEKAGKPDDAVQEYRSALGWMPMWKIRKAEYGHDYQTDPWYSLTDLDKLEAEAKGRIRRLRGTDIPTFVATQDAEVDLLLASLEKRLPKGWTVEARLESRLQPTGWPTGDCTCVLLSGPGRDRDGRPAKADLVMWFMQAGYEGKPPETHPVPESRIAREIGRWGTRRVFAYGSMIREAGRVEAWPTWEADLTAAEQEMKAGWGDAVNGLRCGLSPETQTVEAAEGVQMWGAGPSVTFRVENVGWKSAKFLTWWTPLEGADYGSLTVVGPDGKRPQYIGWAVKRGAPTPDSFVRMLPGGGMWQKVWVPYDMRQPGEYKISIVVDRQKAVDNDWTGHMESNTVTVKVVRKVQVGEER